MKFAQIILSIMTLTACSSNSSDTLAMSCEIFNKAENCSEVPMLRAGQLKLVHAGQFELKGQYSACFHEETVTIHGKYQRSDYNKGMSIELLATKIKGLKSSEFPSTIAVVTLEKTTLKGLIRDVWATIRSPKYANNNSTIEVVCKSG
jgi:hypothetical protein